MILDIVVTVTRAGRRRTRGSGDPASLEGESLFVEEHYGAVVRQRNSGFPAHFDFCWEHHGATADFDTEVCEVKSMEWQEHKIAVLMEGNWWRRCTSTRLQVTRSPTS